MSIISETVPDILFNYLRDAIYDTKNAVLNVNALPEDYKDLGNGLKYFVECVLETKTMAQDLAAGDLNCLIPSPENEIAAPLKSLHASLRHLTWQSQQVANGDYKQRVAFMGTFSDAFNTMIEQLAERQEKLEDELTQIKNKTASLEQSNLLFAALMHHVPQQIIVIGRDTHEILLINDIARNEVKNDADYVKKLINIMSGYNDVNSGSEIDIKYSHGELERYFIVKSYLLEWNNTNAQVFIISDVSATKNKIIELEIHAYQDSLSRLFNRTYGMLTLDSWIHEKRCFILIFADLDHLKFINDEYGHNEGDLYIQNTAKYLKTFSQDTVVCRIGGDEFMLLEPDASEEEAHASMSRINNSLQNDESLEGKSFTYSLSYGIVAIDPDNKLPSSDILSIADERIYINKQMRKKARKAEKVS
jgi:diguanylate cyclase (GGDEF)-like protein